MLTTIPSDADANDYRKSGKYYIGQGITNLPTLEEPIRCILIVEEHSDYVTQTLYDVVYSHNRVFQRCCDYNTWSSWAEISFNIPSFYKNYQNIGNLASAVKGNFVRIGITEQLNNNEKSSALAIPSYGVYAVSDGYALDSLSYYSRIFTYTHAGVTDLGGDGIIVENARNAEGVGNVMAIFITPTFDGTVKLFKLA